MSAASFMSGDAAWYDCKVSPATLKELQKELEADGHIEEVLSVYALKEGNQYLIDFKYLGAENGVDSRCFYLFELHNIKYVPDTKKRSESPTDKFVYKLQGQFTFLDTRTDKFPGFVVTDMSYKVPSSPDGSHASAGIVFERLLVYEMSEFLQSVLAMQQLTDS